MDKALPSQQLCFTFYQRFFILIFEGCKPVSKKIKKLAKMNFNLYLSIFSHYFI